MSDVVDGSGGEKQQKKTGCESSVLLHHDFNPIPNAALKDYATGF